MPMPVVAQERMIDERQLPHFQAGRDQLDECRQAIGNIDAQIEEQYAAVR
jgi:hypothetical protein